ncbi:MULTISPECIES: hypothetical protein [Alphaproteobacteria]|uniref:Lipoprotein n=1 Tax=Sulfitobacter sp. TCYB15 TaxID=3229275 RepID=A0AAU8C5Y3_9RHOB|nr:MULTISPECIES: hypothetical protein [Sulfitobacter]NKX47479.1 hypothetical protein [Rhodobacteraceae bacterium R_SAG8]EAP83743.1 hypothetical protein EE36_11793 [Sulfitobacter sp. EE-36]KAJ31946.1 hypothetical protein PM01_02030 [Sulfitobacter pontiacus 3SOLIMAR09]OAN73854.1 hypothetical protein A8B81_07040 [Sulfitobacter pontiacus]QLL42219.1 hypothetical protein G6548_06630 [Sulfitobacter pontiacus]|eukprot:CAMPEP_0184450800 /NCGR_PEP_ID=MMETSP0740-20130409/6001_1 /TAXON_ID=385413 /ORGANISM="Thalassiosira miniscula, Strain CCMP1093" /LENGTH=68 /DNA_ID=CAMNT_0026821155 /DNA_START=28 /DNA_END=234 /DNA_ORIENTATION=-
MSIKTILLAVTASAGLAACGDTLGEQALGGGVVGAGAAAVTGGSLAQGAAIGAGANVLACQTGAVRCQ